MDTNGDIYKKMFWSYIRIFIIVLTIFVGIKALEALKEYPYIGNGFPPTNVITVSGKGEIMAKPDIADFNFSVVEDGKTAKEAQDKATVKSNAAIDAIKAAGVEDKDIKTTSYNLSPKYEYNEIVCVRYPCPSGRQTIVGYTVSQSIEVKVRKIDDASPLLTKITAIGVSNISGINFIIDDQDALMEQAKEKAIADAKGKAKILAKQLGVRLGRIVSFSDGYGGPIYYAKAYGTDSMMGAEASAPVPQLPTGENEITSNISITYEIR